MSDQNERGNISIHAENILPIIKRWLYSEKEIFIRELVANAADAIHKLNAIVLTGEASREIKETAITISVDKAAKTVTITDSGLGMSAEEVKKYINQVAFSGVKDFVAKYESKSDEQQIIGHFGLGFYSSYMVAHKVEIETLSYKLDSKPVHWSCDGTTEFEMWPGTKTDVGTSIILHISEDSLDVLEEGKLQDLLQKYCAFVRYPIELEGKVVNDPRPIWTRSATELTDKDYLDFYHKLFPGIPDPLFWIHLNVDHPFTLKGVIYFPKLQHELDAQGQIKLYCNQVFVADNIKEVVPEFLTLLRGAIDCPDLPLNVSRSYLQNDPTVQQISAHITKKIADKLSGMAKTDMESYRKYWDEIHPFLKFGMMRDDKFYDRMLEHLIYKLSDGSFLTLNEYLDQYKDKTEDQIIYTTDPDTQSALVKMLEQSGIKSVVANTTIDQHFISFLEMKSGRKFKFKRVDADISKLLIGEEAAQILDPSDQRTNKDKIDEIFRKNLESTGVKIKVEPLKNDDVAGMIVIDENARRMKEMSKFNAFSAFQSFSNNEETLVVNSNHSAVKNILKLAKEFSKENEIKMAVNQIYDLAFLQQGKFTAEKMQAFLSRSAQILAKI